MFRNRSFLGLVAAELVSLTGTAMTTVALPWFVLATTGSTAKMGWVLGAQLLPMGLLGIGAGALISRLGAKRTMLVCDAARGPLMLVLPILHWTGHLSFWALVGASFAVGCFAAPYLTSSTLIAPEVAGYDENATARLSAAAAGGNQVTRIVGPVLAGVLIALIGPANVLVVDAGTYVFSFLTVGALVRVGARVAPTAESQGLLAGLRFLRRDSLLGPLALVSCALNLFVEGLIVGVNALAYFAYDAHVAGLLFGGFGAGALLGALAAQKLVQKGDLLRLAAVALVLMPLPLFVLGVSLPWEAVLPVVALFSFFTPLVNAPIVAVLTVRTPAALRPKVMSAVLTCATLAAPLGFFGGGEALRWISVQALFVVVAGTLTVAALAAAAVLLRERGTARPAPAAASA